MALRRSLSIACVFLLLAGAVSAQQGLGAAVSIEGPTSGSVTVEQTTRFTFDITNDGADSGPFNDQNQADVVVDITNVPDGWTVGVEPAHFKLAPGATQNITLSVLPAAESAESGVLTVRATLTTPAEIFDPVLGNVPGQSQTATAESTLELTRNEGTTRNLLEAIGPWIYLILLALIAAALLATRLVIESRRVTVALHSTEREGSVKPGGRIAMSMEVRNIGKADDTIVFQVNSVGDGWAAFLPIPELDLAKGDTEQLHLVVIAPADAKTGDRQDILVTANSAQGPRHPASITFEIVVQ